MKKIIYILALSSLLVVPVFAQTNQYAYDANGNLTKDLSKGITKIEYNFLNLPTRVVWNTSRYSEYTYDGSGNKLRARHVDGSSVTTLDYCGNFVYENGALKRILIEGGYVEDGEYYFYLQDHLGNNRVVARADGTVVQTNEYYPFGGTLASTGDNVQPYKFGGKELDRANGLNLYDFEARQYDARLGRFTTMDPMAEKYYSISPYAYCNNNPMRFTDPTGMVYTDYEIDKRGYIKAISEPDEKPDRLFGINQATGKKEVLTVKDKKILSALSGETNIVNENRHVPGKRRVTINRQTNERTEEISFPKVEGKAAITNSKTEAKAVFEFAAKTSEVEWGVSFFKNNKAVVGTLNEGSLAPDFSPLGDDYKFENQIYDTHSHGGKVPSIDFTPSGPDLRNARRLKSINPNAESWLYMPQNPNVKWLKLK